MFISYGIFLLLCIIFYIFLRFPAQILETSAASFALWFSTVLPSLFPFLVCCGLLLRLGLTQRLGRLFAPLMRPLFGLSGVCALPFVLGILSGYPLGAKMTAQLYTQKQISQSEAQKLLSFCNNPGPLFVIGTVGTGFFHAPVWGYAMLGSILFGALATGICFRKQYSIAMSSVPISKLQTSIEKQPLGILLSDCVKDALLTAAQIGGFLVFFSVLSTALQLLGVYDILTNFVSFLPFSPAYWKGIYSGILEMTNGAYLLSLAQDGLRLRLSAAVVLLAFGGCSILGQTFGVLQGVPISYGKYLAAKCCNAAFALLAFQVLYPFVFAHTKKAVPVFSAHTAAAFPLIYGCFGFCLFGYAFYRLWQKA